MIKRVGPRLHDPTSWAPLAAEVSSHNQGPTFLTIPVEKLSKLDPHLDAFFVPFRIYWVGLKGLNVLLSRTQAGPGRAVKQDQEENSRNHVRTF